MIRKIFLTSVVLLVSSAGLFAVESSSPKFSPKITPYGFSQFRLRYEAVKVGNSSSTEYKGTYYNKLSYMMGLKAKMAENLLIQLQLGNRYIALESSEWTTLADKDALKPFFHLAYAKWSPGIVDLSVGIIPAINHGTLDLLERSLDDLGTVGYQGASQVSWAVGQENSISGVALGLRPLSTDNFKLSFDVTSALVKTVPNFPSQSEILWIMNMPISVKSILTLTPQLSIVQNRLYNSTTSESDNEIAVGADVKLTPSKSVSFKINGGFAQISDKNTKSASALETKTRGGILELGSTVKAGPGKIILGYIVSTSKSIVDNDDNAKKTTYNYIDMKYAYAPLKNFILMPRLRFFITNPEENYSTSKVAKIRPEMIFIAKF